MITEGIDEAYDEAYDEAFFEQSVADVSKQLLVRLAAMTAGMLGDN